MTQLNLSKDGVQSSRARAKAAYESLSPDAKRHFHQAAITIGAIVTLFLVAPAILSLLASNLFPQLISALTNFPASMESMSQSTYAMVWLVAFVLFMGLIFNLEVDWRTAAFAVPLLLIAICMWLFGPAIPDLWKAVDVTTYFGGQILVAMVVDVFARIGLVFCLFASFFHATCIA